MKIAAFNSREECSFNLLGFRLQVNSIRLAAIVVMPEQYPLMFYLQMLAT